MLTRDAIVASSPVILDSGEHHVLAVHGWFGSASGWGSPPEYLDGSAYTYVFMDLRGYGDRMKVSGQFTMAEAAADVLGLGRRAGLGAVLQADGNGGRDGAGRALAVRPSGGPLRSRPAARPPGPDRRTGLT